jgi:2-polyprenyl-3-methyl-5-hydroxy-6-metoxy-1,4-benzoquinol methylase
LVIVCLSWGCADDNNTSTSQETTTEITEEPITGATGYDEMSEEYYESDARVIWQRPELVMSVLGPLEGRTVADIGAGTGYFAFRLAAAGANVIAIDIDPRAISFMQSEKQRYSADVQERFTTRLASENDPSLANGEVNIVLMVNTYIYIEDRVEYFERLKKGMQQGGELVIIDFKKKKTNIGPDVSDRVALSDVQRELGLAGYKILEIDESTLDYQYVIKAVKL